MPEPRPDPRPVVAAFDVDGTLTDTTYLPTLAWWHAFRQQDVLVPMAFIHRAVGMGADRNGSQLWAI